MMCNVSWEWCQLLMIKKLTFVLNPISRGFEHKYLTNPWHGIFHNTTESPSLGVSLKCFYPPFAGVSRKSFHPGFVGVTFHKLAPLLLGVMVSFQVGGGLNAICAGIIESILGLLEHIFDSKILDFFKKMLFWDVW